MPASANRHVERVGDARRRADGLAAGVAAVLMGFRNLTVAAPVGAFVSHAVRTNNNSAGVVGRERYDWASRRRTTIISRSFATNSATSKRG